MNRVHPKSLKLIVVAALATACLLTNESRADPPPDPDIPKVFCFRFTDMERVSLGDGTSDNDFVFQFEVLNWSDQQAGGMYMAANTGTGFGGTTGSAPMIEGIGVDADGRGGSVGGSDIDAAGTGITSGSGTFDSTAIHSGRGRGDNDGLLNDWSGTSFSTTSAKYDAGSSGTPIDRQDLLNSATPSALIPSQDPPYTAGDLDALGDTSIDGGPGTTVADDFSLSDAIAEVPVSDGTMNVLDGFTLTVSDFDEDEVLSLNWFLTDADGEGLIGSVGRGNSYGFGTINLYRGEGSPTVLEGNTGVSTSPVLFASDPDGNQVNDIPNPAQFAAEFGAGITAPFQNPTDNIFDAGVNTRAIPEPASLMLLAPAGLWVLNRRQRRAPRV